MPIGDLGPGAVPARVMGAASRPGLARPAFRWLAGPPCGWIGFSAPPGRAAPRLLVALGSARPAVLPLSGPGRSCGPRARRSFRLVACLVLATAGIRRVIAFVRTCL